MRNIKVLTVRFFSVVLIFFLFSDKLVSQLSYENYEADVIEAFIESNSGYVSLIAYKLPFRGENYKFYGTLSYHIYGRAYVGCKVHNTIVEAYHLSEQNCKGAYFKMLKSSRRKAGKLIPNHNRKNGKYIDFMVPLVKKGIPLKHYYRTGLLRTFIRFDKSGRSKFNKDINVDFENMARYIINLDNAAHIYGLRIRKIIFNRFLLDELYSCLSGAELKARDIYFAKYLSEKVNRKYDDLFYVEFTEIK